MVANTWVVVSASGEPDASKETDANRKTSARENSYQSFWQSKEKENCHTNKKILCNKTRGKGTNSCPNFLLIFYVAEKPSQF